MTPEQLADKGLQSVPWSELEDVRLDAWYRYKVHNHIWFRIHIVNVLDKTVAVDYHLDIPISRLIELTEHSIDNGKTWHPCHNIRPIGGRIEHEKRMRSDT